MIPPSFVIISYTVYLFVYVINVFYIIKSGYTFTGAGSEEIQTCVIIIVFAHVLFSKTNRPYPFCVDRFIDCRERINVCGLQTFAEEICEDEHSFICECVVGFLLFQIFIDE